MIEPKVELIRYARTGSEQAFRKLVSYYGGLVANSARRRVADSHLAEEVVQNVFTTLAKKAVKVSEYHSISAWLHETTRRESAKALRSQIRHERRVAAVKSDQAPDVVSDMQTQNLRDLLPHLDQALDSLKLSEREVILARFFDEQSFRDIAQQTGKSESACKMRLSRALEKLNLTLSRRGVTFSTATLAILLQTEWSKAASSMPVIATPSFEFTNLFTSIFTAMNNTKILVFAALALLVTAAISLTFREEKSSSQVSPTSTSSSSISLRGSSSELSRHATPRQERKIQKKFIAIHQVEDLEHFSLPTTSFENATLSEVINALLKQYKTICYETKENALPFSWSLEGEALLIPSLQLSGDFLSACKLLAAFTGTHLTIDDYHLSFTEIPEGPSSTRLWQVSPTFVEDIQQLLSLPSNSTAQSELPHLSEFMSQTTFMNPDESITINGTHGFITVTGGARNLKRIDSLVEIIRDRTPVQYHLQFESSCGQVLSDIIAHLGESSDIEIGNVYLETIDDQEVEAFIGTHISVTPELYGFGEKILMTYTHTNEPSEEHLKTFKRTGHLDDLQLEQFVIEDRQIVKTSEHQQENVPLEISQQDVHRKAQTITINSQRIDATGTPIILKKDNEEKITSHNENRE